MLKTRKNINKKYGYIKLNRLEFVTQKLKLNLKMTFAFYFVLIRHSIYLYCNGKLLLIFLS